MFTYRNDKGATITTACEITGGGWTPVSEAATPKQNTRAEGDKEQKGTVKRKRNE